MKRITHVPVILLASLLLVSAPSRLWAVAPRVTITTKTMKNSEYIEKYAAFAQEQMIKYGIPASVTLAQGILESASGGSELSRKGNNHFGIKATSSWLNAGGSYLVYTDDKPNEKFCRYASVGDSYEHHSLFLKNNSRYARCFRLAPDDYKGWTTELQRAGYATSKSYAASLQNIIERNGLQKYDQQVLAMTGRTPTVSAISNQNDLAHRSSALPSSPTPAGQNGRSSESHLSLLRNGRVVTDEDKVNVESQQEQPKPRNNESYFNTIRADASDGQPHDDDWEKKMLCSEDGSSQHPSADPILDLAVSTFTGLMGVAVMIDSGVDQAQIQDAAAKVPKGKLDFSSLSSSLFEQGMAAQEEQGSKLHV